jgi:hypothetical protein
MAQAMLVYLRNRDPQVRIAKARAFHTQGSSQAHLAIIETFNY